MKIEITREECLHLLDLLYVARGVLDGHAPGGEREETAPYRSLHQKIMDYFREVDPDGRWIARDPESCEYRPTERFEEERPASEFLSRFAEDTFWSELVHRLADRDMTEEHGQSWRDRPIEQWIGDYENLLDAYTREFGENGLRNLRVVS